MDGFDFKEELTYLPAIPQTQLTKRDHAEPVVGVLKANDSFRSGHDDKK